MIRVYVAGPITAPTHNEYRENIEMARSAALWLLQKGYAPHVPALETALMEGAVSYERFLEADFAWLEMADAIVLLPEWQESYGACLELQEALRRGMAVYEMWTQFDEGWHLTLIDSNLQRLVATAGARVARGRAA